MHYLHYALGDTKQKKPTPLDWGPPLHVNRVLKTNLENNEFERLISAIHER